MPFQRTYLADRAIQTNNDTVYRQDMPKTGYISAIGLGIRITNGATSGTEQIVDAIDRIEVIANGSFPLISMTGRTAYAYTSLMLKRRPPQVRTMVNGAVQELFLLVPFGFSIWDPRHYLDLARYNQLQLAVTYSPTISATTFATGTVTFTVELFQWTGNESPGVANGYLRFREIATHTTLATGDTFFLLPTENPLLGLLILSREAGIAIETDLTRLRLLDKIGGSEIYNRRVEDAMAENDWELGLEAIERGLAFRIDADTLDTDVNFIQALSLLAEFTQSDANGIETLTYASTTGDRVVLSVNDLADAAATTHFTAEATLTAIRWIAVGRGLPHAIYVPLHHWGRPETAYPAQQRDQLQLILTQAGADANVRINALELGA